ncbi:MAG: DoxX family protein [Nitrospirales bacterium]
MMKKAINTTLAMTLGVMFIMAGGVKLLAQQSQVEHFAHWGYPLWFLYFTGIVEVCGGLCLFVPKAQFYGVVALSITMVGAAGTHLRAGELGAFPIPLVLLGLLFVLAWTMRKSSRQKEE